MSEDNIIGQMQKDYTDKAMAWQTAVSQLIVNAFQEGYQLGASQAKKLYGGANENQC